MKIKAYIADGNSKNMEHGPLFYCYVERENTLAELKEKIKQVGFEKYGEETCTTSAWYFYCLDRDLGDANNNKTIGSLHLSEFGDTVKACIYPGVRPAKETAYSKAQDESQKKLEKARKELIQLIKNAPDDDLRNKIDSMLSTMKSTNKQATPSSGIHSFFKNIRDLAPEDIIEDYTLPF